MQPVVTVFCAFTRRWRIDDWLREFENVKHDPANTNLCFIVDCDEMYIANRLQQYAGEKGYRSIHVKVNENNHPNEVRLSIRRARVAEVKNQSKDLIGRCDGDIVICFEDDTVLERLESLEQLYFQLVEDTNVAFVEGVQMGRWGANMLGVWRLDNYTDPTHAETLLPESWSGLQDITGGGFYGYATFKKLYLQHEYYTSSGQPWGPDVNYGIWLKQRGFRCLVDWSLLFGHADHVIIAYPDSPPKGERLVSVEFTKSDLNGKWERQDHEPGRW